VPIYEYACSKCGEQFEELLRSFRDEQSLVCPRCGGKQLARRLSVFAPRGKPSPQGRTPAGICQRCGDPNGPCALE